MVEVLPWLSRWFPRGVAILLKSGVKGREVHVGVERGGRKLVGDVLQVSGAELGLSVHVSNKVKSLVSGLLGPPSWLAGP